MVPRILSRDQVRDVDRRALEDYGIPGMLLMENAGRGATDFLCRMGCQGPVVICAGKGNNGGDGFVIARHLAIRGVEVRLLLFDAIERLQGDAATNFRILQRSGLAGQVVPLPVDTSWLSAQLSGAEWIVDALLGTGTQGALREPYLTVIKAINRSGKPVLAVDLPSGLDCDTGESLGACIRATATATFVALKPGFETPSGREFTGTVEVIDIGVPPSLFVELLAAAPA